MISGTELAIGTPLLDVSIPTTPRPHPHWKQAVTTPKAAQTEKTLANAACAGIAIDRNAIRSTAKPSAMTVKITRPSLLEIPEARSTYDAVDPPTCTSRPVPCVDCGIT